MSDMGSYYQCSDPDSNEKNWTGHIRPLNINRNEFEVTARGSTFHLLVGKHAYGKYLCIPNWGIGTEISSLLQTLDRDTNTDLRELLALPPLAYRNFLYYASLRQNTIYRHKIITSYYI